MIDEQLMTPIVLMIFNRPDTTEQVFAQIAKVRPLKLLVIGDGPRLHKIGEDELVRATRAIINKINWPCEILTNFSNKNLGCKDRIASGLDWVFENVEEAIILEDDCLPNLTFFKFCEEMLNKYKKDNRIAMISGNNFLFKNISINTSYYFSRYTHVWGWATWRRAWLNYDVSMSNWPTLKQQQLIRLFTNNNFEALFWTYSFDMTYDNKINTWDYQWQFSTWSQNQLSIMPSVNLVSNIGFDSRATHTLRSSILSKIPTEDINFPLSHPNIVVPNYLADRITAKRQFTKSKLTILIKYILRTLVRIRKFIFSSLSNQQF